ncbi:UvrD-helicase domain-containing protein [Clavibacter michiganensis]|uniref:UvrD-helicase domain-containing protein n=1 Tax=Clavibacter michiganensis TaxID=28447 RepID=UPI0029306694|nr:UvrD-helicase domain-containing protein [Clavibacter michiganensis]
MNDFTTDDWVDVEIAKCLLAESPRSFFVFAGAGSGKTRSLILALEAVLAARESEFAPQGQSVAVITFTNAAANEISERLQHSELVKVSTIHSFAWSLVREFSHDIREWLKGQLEQAIITAEAAGGKPGTKKEDVRLYKLGQDKALLTELDSIRRFTYNPAGDNREQGALGHSQVIKLAADLLITKPTLARILITRHPVLLIDESQDTNKHLLEAFMSVASTHAGRFVLGLFGDSMQRIYNEGKTDMEAAVPADWAQPVKVMNHRSPSRIVQLSNRIRAEGDGRIQQAREDGGDGCVRLFIAANGSDPGRVEVEAARHMAEATGDSNWLLLGPNDVDPSGTIHVKRLILEHSMAAERLGFGDLYRALRALPNDRTNVLDGSVPELQVFLKEVVSLIDAHGRGDAFSVARIVREGSPLLSSAILRESSAEPGALRQRLLEADAAVGELAALWGEGAMPTFGAVVRSLSETGLFTLRAALKVALLTYEKEGDEESLTESDSAWHRAFAVPFSEVENYGRYFAGGTSFATHQGVKGLEFPRVMVVISDDEAKGFMFSYEKLMGVKKPTAADAANAASGKDSSLSRTRRLMYVTATRASKFLAVVAYTTEPESVRQFALSNKWFFEDEIVLL